MENKSSSYQNKGKLKLVLAITLTYLAAEVAGGVYTGSLALLADSGHMLTDVGGLALALVAINIAGRDSSDKRTYGYYRRDTCRAGKCCGADLGISIHTIRSVAALSFAA